MEVKTLSHTAVAQLGQLFVCGPTWIGNLISKQGCVELIDHGLAVRDDAWNTLTQDGMRLAVNWSFPDLARRHETQWLDKFDLQWLNEEEDQYKEWIRQEAIALGLIADTLRAAE